ncbi:MULTISPECIES: hypothetical protein [unclassified Megasphaera]|jgi:hypothetical protein|uniref:hypothetical protein n=1 Tax=unclassified Megasphaera TaxID=2626256 RepID=UPI000357E669|nr:MULTISPECIES: hypothetical protein [unclassified Megasphaera]EPP17708.1 hypothetical protein G153_00785 [Megasphaera sp. BL7]EPP18511.1 hypothetical protein NM10_03071 [Megasphaera sp. NM10]
MDNFIEITNDNGKVLVNSAWHNLSLSRKYTLNGRKSYTVPVSPNELIAIQINGSNMWAYVDRDPNYAYILMDGNPLSSEIRNPATSLTCTVYIFGENKGTSNCGLEIYNDAGEQIFSSALKYLKPVDCVGLSQGDKKVYGVPIAIVCGAPWEEDTNGEVFDRWGYKMDNVYTVKCIDLGGTIDEEDMHYPAGDFGDCDLLIIDVTNF